MRTTDLGRLDDDGFLWIVGRADETIVRGGFKVQPEVVRAALERHPHVREAAVVGIDDERLGRVPVAAVEPVDKELLDADAVLEHAAAFLARYELPVEVLIVDELPRTVSDKVDLAGRPRPVRPLTPLPSRPRSTARSAAGLGTAGAVATRIVRCT